MHACSMHRTLTPSPTPTHTSTLPIPSSSPSTLRYPHPIGQVFYGAFESHYSFS